MYRYTEQRPKIFTPEGLTAVIKTRDNAKDLIQQAGAAMLCKIMNGTCNDSWLAVACVEYLVERGEIREIPQQNVATQHRIFVKA
jgi:hypothetical protein